MGNRSPFSGWLARFRPNRSSSASSSASANQPPGATQQGSTPVHGQSNTLSVPDESSNLASSSAKDGSATLADPHAQADTVSVQTKRSHTSINGFVDNFATALLSPTSGRRSAPKSLLKTAALLKDSDEDTQTASFAAYKVVIVDNQTNKQKQFQFKARASNEVILQLSLRGVAVYPSVGKVNTPITQFEYKNLKAITIKETLFDNGLKIVAFEIESDRELVVSAYASYHAVEVVDKLKVLIRKARYMGYF